MIPGEVLASTEAFLARASMRRGPGGISKGDETAAEGLALVVQALVLVAQELEELRELVRSWQTEGHPLVWAAEPPAVVR